MGWLKTLGVIVARLLLRTAMDRQLREAVFEGVMIAEDTGFKGEAKMKKALEHIRTAGGRALIRETESTLRTKVEQAIDELIPVRADQTLPDR